MVKEVVITLWWVFLGTVLLWLTAHFIMAIYKTILCDKQVKLFRMWKSEVEQELKKVRTKGIDKQN